MQLGKGSPLAGLTLRSLSFLLSPLSTGLLDRLLLVVLVSFAGSSPFRPVAATAESKKSSALPLRLRVPLGGAASVVGRLARSIRGDSLGGRQDRLSCDADGGSFAACFDGPCNSD
jgi:hypothetical protein